MKYVNSAFTNIIIHNFKQVAAAVITYQQMFIQSVIPQFLIPGMVDGMAYIFSAYFVPECRFVILNEDFQHTLFYGKQ
jgi:hypothetical protein